MKRLLLIMLACILIPVSSLCEWSGYVPDLLVFEQNPSNLEHLSDTFYTRYVYPVSVNETVNHELRELIDTIHAEGKSLLPSNKQLKNVSGWLDTGSSITRSGTQWLSFLTTGCINYNNRQTWLKLDVRTYDMSTGHVLLLGDLFPSESPVWNLISEKVRKQLSSYYNGENLIQDELDHICDPAVLVSTSFAANMASLSLYYHSSVLFPDTQTLLSVRIPYRDIVDYMTDEVRLQTDNSSYKMVALTFDDGPARIFSTNAVYNLRLYGANATFFCVGTRLAKFQAVLAYEQNAGNLIGSHNWQHDTYRYTGEQILKYTKQFDQTLSSLIGIKATVLRAPGNYYLQFINAKAGLPIFGWSLQSNDVEEENADAIARLIIGHIKPGDIVLMHDINPKSHQYLPVILRNFQKRGIVCITLEEMFDAYGLVMEPDTLYTSFDAIE